MRNIWIEKTSFKDRKDRTNINGDRALTKAIWCPIEDPSSKNMLMVKKGDIIIHFIDNQVIRSISIVKSPKISECKGLEELDGTSRGSENSCYIWYLHSFENLSYVFDKKIFLNKDYSSLLEKIADTSEVFYSKKLSLKPTYLTNCSKELLTHLYREYRLVSGRKLPHISNELIYPDSISLESEIDERFYEIKAGNKDFLPVDSKEVTHNAVVNDIADKFISDLNFEAEEVYRFVGTGRGGGDIDLVIGYEETALIFEIKSRSKTPALKKEFENFYGRKNKYEKFIKEKDLFNSKYTNLTFIFVAYNFNLSNLKKMNNNLIDEGYKKIDKTFYILHKSMFNDYFEMGNKVDRIYARRELLKTLDISPLDNKSLKIPAIRTDYKNMQLYTFTCSAKHLTLFATVSRKLMGGKGYRAYQRRLDGTRLKKISTFLDNDGNFVNNIIIRFKSDSINFEEYEFETSDFDTANNISMGILNIKPSFHSSFVIDGQHRLFSFLKSNKDTNISVSALVDVSDLDEAKYFVDINQEGVRVNQDLIWDLDGEIDGSSERGIISNAVKNLNTNENEFNIFYENLKIPSMENKGFSFNGICKNLFKHLRMTKKMWYHLRDSSTLINNPFYSKNSDKFTKNITLFITDFIIELNKRLKRDMQFLKNDKIQEKLWGDTTLRIFIKIAKYYQIFKITKDYSDDDRFYASLADIFNTYSRDKKQQVKSITGRGNINTYEKELVSSIQDNFNSEFGPEVTDDFGDDVLDLIELKLPNWVDDQIKQKYPGKEWVKELFESNDKKWNKIQKDSIHIGDPVHLKIEWDEYRQIITSDSRGVFGKANYYDKIFKDKLVMVKNGFSSFQDIATCWEQLQKYRVMTKAHGERKDRYTPDKRQKVEAYFNQLSNLIGSNN